ncbi:MAG TPA: GAF domain-containing SpoIIE family protein phosphatase [Gemmatimonadaceae bacterium]|nr:GAF domain-containing SpoIIE family protein phosphatase [Gemmatimonadaceae bacterium]
MNELTGVLVAFRAATRCEAAVWLEAEGTGLPRAEARTPGAPQLPSLPRGPDFKDLTIAGQQVRVTQVPGPRPVWLAVGPCDSPTANLGSLFEFLLPVVTQYIQSGLEVEHAANELAERYEEINLLYSISEILGRAVTLDETARTILGEISGTVGARRGAILVYDRAAEALLPVAVLGTDITGVKPIPLGDESSVSARVFRQLHAVLAEDGEMQNDLEAPYRRGAMLSVPIMWTAPRGSEPLGVVNLSDRRSGHPFTAGDQKLISAIATQIGTAIQNARLVRASVEQQRLQREMQLAHELQMKLLPRSDIVAPDARVAARVVPAESVGGDFYNLFKLSQGCTGVMIGDVSGHGYQAALIMALTMSASAIQAQRTNDPGETMHALFSSVREELATTEMFISGFYAIVDRNAREIWYSNTGHPHAFVFSADGSFERLAAADPPLGMAEGRPATVRRPWDPRDDLLVLFTDGISDARNRAGERLGETKILDVIAANQSKDPAVILEKTFAMLERHVGNAPQRDDLTLVLLRS